MAFRIRFVNGAEAIVGGDAPLDRVELFELEERVGAAIEDIAIHNDTAGSNHQDSEAIAVVGLACRFPGADGPEEFWQNLVHGLDSIVDLGRRRFDIAGYYDPRPGTPGKSISRWAGLLEGIDRFDAKFFGISDREAELMDPQQRLLLETAWTLLESAGYSKGDEKHRTGVFVGASHSEYLQRLWTQFHSHPERIEFHASTGNNLALVANRLSYQLNLTGPSLTLDTACSSSLVAVCQAMESLRLGVCDAAIAGGVNVLLSPENFVAASQAGMLSSEGRCKSFDERGDGYVRSEGVGLVLLRRLSDALRDGDAVYGVLAGATVNQDGRTNGLTAPSGPSQTRLLTAAWRRAGIDARALAYVEAHGTGTSLGDPIEVRALDEALRQAGCPPQSVAIGSVKTNIGHAEAAAGIASLIKAILVVGHRVLPPTLHITEPNRHLDFAESRVFVNDRQRDWPGTGEMWVGVSSFGMGGTNAHIVVRSPPLGQPASPRPIPSPHVFDRRSYWFPWNDVDKSGTPPIGSDLLYETIWSPAPVGNRRSMSVRDWWIVDPDPARANLLERIIREFGANATIAPSVPADSSIVRGSCGVILSLLGKTGLRGDDAIRMFRTLLSWVQTLGLDSSRPSELLVLVDAADTGLDAFGSAAAVLLEAASREMTHLQIRCVGITTEDPKEIASIAREELSASVIGTTYFHRDGNRFARRIVARPVPIPADPWASEGTFVIVGGFGDVGGHIARHLAKTGRNIVLWGRSAFGKDRLNQVRELEESGADILVVQGDVSVERDVQRCLREVRSRYGTIDAVLLAAGDTMACRIANATDQDVEAAFRARVLGSEFVLDHAADARTVVFCGSASSFYPEVGQGVYGAANAYLDALARTSTSTDRSVLSIAWGPWEGTQAVSSANYQALMSQVGVAPLDIREALDAFDALVATHRSAAVLRLTPDRRRSFLGHAEASSILPEAIVPTPADLVDYVSLVRKAVSEVLRTPLVRIDVHSPFQEIGLDSILGMELCGRLKKELGLASLSPTVVFEHSSIDRLAAHLASRPQESRIESLAAVSRPVTDDHKAVAIIGMAARFPSAEDIEGFWQRLVEGTDCVGAVSTERVNLARRLGAQPDVVGRVGGFLAGVDQFDASFFRMTGREAERVDPRHRLFLEVAYHAIEHAGYGNGRLEGTRTGVYVASGPSDYILQGERPDEYWATGCSSSTLASRLSYFLDLRGPCLPIDTACSSSLTALHLAVGAIRRQEIDGAIVGAAHLNLRLENFKAFEKIGALSKIGRCQPFSASADGFIPSEGVAAVVLKPLDRAIADGDPVHGVILGSAMNNDGRSNGLTAPNLAAQRDVLQSAWKDAGIRGVDLEYLEAHGTGTELGDPVELEAIRQAMGHRGPNPLLVGSVKSNLGHAEAAAGMASLLKVILSFDREIIPPSLHSQSLNPHFNWPTAGIEIARSARSWPRSARRRIAGVSAFGFSGTNVHVVVADPPSRLPIPSKESTTRSLRRYVRRHYWKGEWNIGRLFWQVEWEAEGAWSPTEAPNRGSWLVVHAAEESNLARALTGRMERAGASVARVPTTEAAKWIGQNPPDCLAGIVYVDEGPSGKLVDPAQLERHQALLSLVGSITKVAARSDFRGQELAFTSGADSDTRRRLLVATRDAQPTGREDNFAITSATLLGLARVLPAELKEWVVRSVDIASEMSMEVAADVLAAELAVDGPGEVAYRQGRRLVRRLVRSCTTEDPTQSSVALDKDGVYLVLGGLGGVGQQIAELLLERGCAGLLVVGRSPSESSAVRDTIDRLRSRARHSAIEYISADITDPGAVRQLFDEITLRFGRLDGVVQAAGVLDSDHLALRAKTPESFAAVLAPKVRGSWNLAQELRGRFPSTWFVLLSSVSCLSAPLGAGQSDYAAASRFQWHLAHWLRRNGLPKARAILLSEWDNVGMIAGTGVGPVVRALGLRPIDRYEAKRAFEATISGPCGDNAWLDVDPTQFAPERMLEDDLKLKTDEVALGELGRLDELDRFASIIATANQMSLAYLESTFSQAKLFHETGSRATRDEVRSRLALAPKYDRWLDDCLRRFVQLGDLERTDRGYAPLRVFRSAGPISLDDCATDVPGGSALLSLVRRFGQHLSEVLAGRCDPISLLFPDGSLDEAGEIHGSHVLARRFSSLAAEAIRSVIRRSDGPLRILEVGAGTGGTTESLLRELLGENIEYTFTDISTGFFRRAKERLAFWSGPMDWRTFDLNHSGLEQGLVKNGYDVVIATNVLHAVRRLDDSLAHLRELLSPSGTLLLTELVEVPAWIEQTFGLTDGWWAFEDAELRVRGPILDVEAWRTLLQKANFSVIATRPDAPSKLAAFGQRMFVARVGVESPVRVDECARWLRSRIADFARIPREQLDPTRNFMDQGIDSILALQLRRDLERELEISLEATVTFSQPNVRQLASFLLENHPSVMRRVLGAANDAEALTLVQPLLKTQESDEQRTQVAKAVIANAGDVAVIGMACRFPGAGTPEELLANSLQGKELIGRMPASRGRHCTDGEAVDLVGAFLDRIEDFDASRFGLTSHETRMMDPQQRLFLEATWEAVERAGYAPEELTGRRCAVFAGSNANEYLSLLAACGDAGDPYAHSGNAGSAISTRVSYLFDLRGPSLSIDSACSSSLSSVYLAVEGLRSGQFDLAIAGGVNVILRPSGTRMVREYGMLSPSGRSHSFDDRADGFVRGEGCGVVLLKRLADAVRDRDNVLAVVKGIASNNDGAAKAGLPAPSSASQCEVIRMALEDGDVAAETIGLIEAHGTGTALGDPIEVEGLTKAFQAQTRSAGYCALSSVKSHIGHAEAAAGIAGLIFAIQAIREGMLPPTGDFHSPNRHIGFEKTPFFVNERARPWADAPRRAGVSSFGFGGTNVHVVLEEGPLRSTSEETIAGPQLLPLSAEDDSSLRQLVERYRDWIRSRPELDFADVCFTAAVGRRHYPARIAIVASSLEQLADRLEILHLTKRWEALPVSVASHGVVARDDSELRTAVRSELDSLCLAHPELSEELRRVGLRAEGFDPCRNADALTNSTRAAILPFVARLYVRGARVDWGRLTNSAHRRRVELPTYPFQRRRHWLRESARVDAKSQWTLQGEELATNKKSANASPGATTAEVDGLLHESVSVAEPAGSRKELCGYWLLLADEEDVTQRLTDGLRTAGVRVTLCKAGARFARAGEEWTIHPDNLNDYRRLLSEIPSGEGPIHVVHLWARQGRVPETVFDFEERLAFGPRSLLLVAAALARCTKENTSHLYCVTRGSSPERHPLDPEYSAMAAILRSVAIEQPKIQCRTIHCHADSLEVAAALIIEELTVGGGDTVVEVESNQRHGVRLRPLDLLGVGRRDLAICQGGCYLITGGMGGIGLELARWLARRYQARLVLVGPTSLAVGKEGPVAQFALDDRGRRRREAIDEIEALGSEVLWIAARVQDLEAMTAAFSQAARRFGRINGVLHLAGVLRDGPLDRLTIEDYDAVWQPKAQGAWVLDRLTRLYPPDWTVYFSSVAAALGSPHQAVYGGANAYLDGLAEVRSRENLPTISIQWGLWGEVGMGRAACEDPSVLTHLVPMSPHLALEAIPRVLTLDTPVVAVAKFAQHSGNPAGTDSQRSEFSGPWSVERKPPEESTSRVKPSRQEIAEELANRIAELLEISSDEIDVHQSLAELGLDSVLFARLRRDLESRIGQSIPFTLLRDYPTPWAISEFLQRTVRPKEDSHAKTQSRKE